MEIESFEELDCCRLCPRSCGVNRNQGETGVCGTDSSIYLARAALHMWEEPCISGRTGSGAVFFSGCSLRCVYCQNYEIANMQVGKKVSVKRLAKIFLELQEKGAANINLVSPSHYAPQVRKALGLARKSGLSIPAVYNCSGYEKTEALRQLEGVIDIYLTDFKYMDASMARRYSGAEDYPETARAALAEMFRQHPEAVFDSQGMMQKGIIVRHLLLPGALENAKAAVKYVYEVYKDKIWLSLLNQYTPFPRVEKIYPELAVKVTQRQYEKLVDYAISLGVENGFIQEGETAKESFIPDFNYEGIEEEKI